MVIINPCEITVVEPCGVNPAYTYTRYPCDFDDPRSGNSKGLPVIVDLQTPVKAEVVNRQRESILAIEGELGIQPSGTFTTVRDRLDSLESVLCSVWNTITSGLISPINIQWNGSTIVGNVSNLNFTGSGVQVTNSGVDTAIITITGGGLGGDGYAPVHERVTVSTNGQTTFTLNNTPWNRVLLLFIGGIKQEIADYNVTGKQLTWSGSVVLNTFDVVEVEYFTDLGGGGGSSSVPALTVTDEGFLVQNEVSILNFVGAGVTATSLGSGIVNVRVDATGSTTEMRQEVFNPTTAQIIFTLSGEPIDQQSTEMFISGVSQAVGIDYTVSGSVLTYIGSIDLTGEEVVIKYFEMISLTIDGISSILKMGNTTDGYNINFSGSSTAINLKSPINPTDAATKAYVDGYFGSYDFGSPLSVSEYNIQVEDEVTVINFIGTNVEVTSTDTGKVNVEITGNETVMHQEVFTATSGQTIFSLSYLPISEQTTEVFINGISQTVGVDYTVYINNITYIGDVSIKDGDIVVVKFFESVSVNPEYTQMHQEVFIVDFGQTTFSLNYKPISQQSTEMFINGVSQAVGIDYTVFDKTITYIGEISLSGLQVVIKYFSSIFINDIGLPTVLDNNNSTDGYNIDFGGISTAINLRTPTNASEAASKGYIDGYINNYLPLSGGILFGDLSFGGISTVTNLKTPTNASEAVSKGYVDGYINNYLPLSGGILSGDLNIGGNNLYNFRTDGIDGYSITGGSGLTEAFRFYPEFSDGYAIATIGIRVVAWESSIKSTSGVAEVVVTVRYDGTNITILGVPVWDKSSQGFPSTFNVSLLGIDDSLSIKVQPGSNNIKCNVYCWINNIVTLT